MCLSHNYDFVFSNLLENEADLPYGLKSCNDVGCNKRESQVSSQSFYIDRCIIVLLHRILKCLQVKMMLLHVDCFKATFFPFAFPLLEYAHSFFKHSLKQICFYLSLLHFEQNNL